MSRITPRFGFLVIEQGDDPFQQGYKFFAADRDTMDWLLYQALTGHVHDGSADVAVTAPTVAPELTLDTLGGSIPASTRIWYTYTLVSQATGAESIAAPSAFIDTPAKITPPSRPILARGSTGGTLLPGQYFYVLSAWVDTPSNETNAPNPAGISIPVGTVTNRVVITFPDPAPAGAQGFNIYRRKPGGVHYDFIASVDLDVATPPTQYVDTGILEDCDRIAPQVNTTNSTNAIEIGYPTATPTVPPGYTWKIYRTVNQDDWSASLLHHVVEETFDLSGIITPAFDDLGFTTTTGAPPAVQIDYPSPEKIQLTDAANIQGYLPMGRVSAFPVVVTFFFPGAQTVGVGESEWPLPFDQAVVVSASAALGRGSLAASTALIADVVVGRGATPMFTSVYAAQGDKPTIPVAGNKTSIAAPATGSLANRSMQLGDVLSADVIQTGGGATPTDEDLTVTVVLYVQVGSETISETWP